MHVSSTAESGLRSFQSVTQVPLPGSLGAALMRFRERLLIGALVLRRQQRIQVIKRILRLVSLGVARRLLPPTLAATPGLAWLACGSRTLGWRWLAGGLGARTLRSPRATAAAPPRALSFSCLAVHRLGRGTRSKSRFGRSRAHWRQSQRGSPLGLRTRCGSDLVHNAADVCLAFLAPDPAGELSLGVSSARSYRSQSSWP